MPFDMEAFQEALQELMKADGAEAMTEVVAGHPVLLSEEADTAFEMMIAAAQAQGEEEAAGHLRGLREMLKMLREAMNDKNDMNPAENIEEPAKNKGGLLRNIGKLILAIILSPILLVLILIQKLLTRFGRSSSSVPSAFHAEIQQAQAAQQRYQQGGGIQALDESVAAWERILKHPDFAGANEDFRLKVLNDSGIAFIYRYQARGDMEYLDRALSSWQKAVSLTPENSPDLPGSLNNLGGGLQTRYARSGDLSDLEAGIAAFEKAVSLTPENSPDLPSRLNNLGTGLTDRYARSGDLSDLEAGIAAYEKAVSLTPKTPRICPLVSTIWETVSGIVMP